MNIEEKQIALQAAIEARDLPKVSQLVEDHNCKVTGPEPFNQVPLNLAAKRGDLAIVEYLIARGARPNAFTAKAAIASGSVYMLRFIDEKAPGWTKTEYEAAFNSSSWEIQKYAFELASEKGWFEDPMLMNAHEGNWNQYQILSAARQSLTSLPDYEFNDIIAFLKENGETRVLYTVPDGEPILSWLHGLIREDKTQSFSIAWDIIHSNVFSGQRHADLDGHYAEHEVKDLFYTALEYRCNEIFFRLLNYGLPNFHRCLEVARKCDNFAMFDYLSKYVTPVSQ
jgi:hypothetical protein